MNIHHIFDRYDSPLNPNSQERTIMVRHYDIEANRPLLDWNKVMSNDTNKSVLILFLCKYIEQNIELPVNPTNKYLAGG